MQLAGLLFFCLHTDLTPRNTKPRLDGTWFRIYDLKVFLVPNFKGTEQTNFKFDDFVLAKIKAEISRKKLRTGKYVGV